MKTLQMLRSGLSYRGKSIIHRYAVYAILVCTLSFQMGCIGDDIILDRVDPIVRIMNAVDTLALGSDYEFTYTYFNETGEEEMVSGARWTSDNPTSISITDDGLATALEEGSANISVDLTTPTGTMLMDAQTVVVGTSTVANSMDRTGTLRTTSSYKLEGSFTMTTEEGKLILNLSDDYEASSNLPGLFVYLTNNPNTTNNAHEIGAVEVFKGAHKYEIENVGLNDFSHVLYFCKPFVVKVGDGAFDN